MLLVGEVGEEGVAEEVDRLLDRVVVVRVRHVVDERPVDVLDRVVDDEVLFRQPVDHRLEGRVAAHEVREDRVVLEPVVTRDGSAVARAERAERPVVLAERHVVQRRAGLARGEAAFPHLAEDVAQLGELGAEHVVDVDQVLPDEPAAVE